MADVKKYVAAALLSLSVGGLGFISHNEGRVKHAYLDQTGTPTICDGHTRNVKMGQVATDSVCDMLLNQDTTIAQADVRRLVKVPITQEQYDALVDFAFNAGGGNLASSTLLARVNAGDCRGAGAQFPLWNKSRGKVLPGLTVRRAAERKLWESGC